MNAIAAAFAWLQRRRVKKATPSGSASEQAMNRGCPWHVKNLVTFGEDVVEVDEGIADLLLEVWAVEDEVTTLNSCHDGGGMVWLEFYSGSALATFLNVVTSHGADEDEDDPCERLSNRVMHEWRPTDGWEAFEEERVWKYGSRHWVVVDANGLNNWGMAASVWFPLADLEEVVDRLREHNMLAMSP